MTISTTLVCNLELIVQQRDIFINWISWNYFVKVVLKVSNINMLSFSRIQVNLTINDAYFINYDFTVLKHHEITQSKA